MGRDKKKKERKGEKKKNTTTSSLPFQPRVPRDNFTISSLREKKEGD